MSESVDRAATTPAGLALGFLALALIVLNWVSFIQPPVYDTGVQTASTINGRLQVTSAPGSLVPLGVASGKRFAAFGTDLAQRLRIRYGAPRNYDIDFVPVSAGAEIAVPARVRRVVPFGVGRWVSLAAGTLALAIVGYLGARRPGIMALALILYSAGIINTAALMRTFSGLDDALYAPIGVAVVALFRLFPNLVLASFAVRFPGRSTERRARRWVGGVDALVLIGLLVETVAIVTGFGFRKEYIAGYLIFAAGLVVLAALESLHATPPAARARVQIVIGAIVIAGLLYATYETTFTMTDREAIINWGSAIAALILPVAVAYAVLRHRIFDISFVLNMTLVYGVTSVIVLLALAAAEYFVEGYLRQLSHLESAAVEFGLALSVIIGARIVHGWVDRLVDQLLFRSRHNQETGLRRFATTAQFYTEAAPLVRDTVDAVVRDGHVEAAAVYLATEDGPLSRAASTFPNAPATVDENDSAYVQLRAHRGRLDLRHAGTALPGASACAMILAGRPVGVIAVGERLGRESMPPDIGDALEGVAAAVGLALEAIELRVALGENERLRHELSSVPAASR